MDKIIDWHTVYDSNECDTTSITRRTLCWLRVHHKSRVFLLRIKHSLINLKSIKLTRILNCTLTQTVYYLVSFFSIQNRFITFSNFNEWYVNIGISFPGQFQYAYLEYQKCNNTICVHICNAKYSITEIGINKPL